MVRSINEIVGSLLDTTFPGTKIPVTLTVAFLSYRSMRI